MAMLDNSLLLSDAQEVVTSTASTSHIDTKALGDAYVAPWFVVRVDTAYTSGGSLGRVQFQLQDSANGDFYDGVTLAQTSTLAPAVLLAGYIWKVRLPVGIRRYIRGYQAQTIMPATAGKVDMFIVQDVDLERQLA